MRFGATVAALIACLASGNVLADDKCQLVRAASVDMGVDSNGGVEVPMTIAGKQLTLLVDTGGYASLLNESVVKVLGLRHDPMRDGEYLTMFGGTRIDKAARGRDVEFGGLHAHGMTFAMIPDGHLPEGVDGTLSPDIMASYDAEFDFAANKFNLYLRSHCRGQVVYWTSKPYAVVPVRMPDNIHIDLDVMLDGKPFRAILDTGSTRSIVRMEEIQSVFGIKDNDPNLKPLADGGSSRFYTYPFKTLSLEGLTINNPSLLVAPRSTERTPDNDPEVILGMGVLRQLHLYIAYGERNLYITGATTH